MINRPSVTPTKNRGENSQVIPLVSISDVIEGTFLNIPMEISFSDFDKYCVISFVIWVWLIFDMSFFLFRVPLSETLFQYIQDIKRITIDYLRHSSWYDLIQFIKTSTIFKPKNSHLIIREGKKELMIQIKNLSKIQDGRTMLDLSDIIINSGEIHALIGTADSGLEILLNLLIGTASPSAGEITINGFVAGIDQLNAKR